MHAKIEYVIAAGLQAAQPIDDAFNDLLGLDGREEAAIHDEGWLPSYRQGEKPSRGETIRGVSDLNGLLAFAAWAEDYFAEHEHERGRLGIAPRKGYAVRQVHRGSSTTGVLADYSRTCSIRHLECMCGAYFKGGNTQYATCRRSWIGSNVPLSVGPQGADARLNG